VEKGAVRYERLTPQGADTSRAIVYHHGGGYSFGSLTSHRHLVARLAEAAGVVAYSVDYRLAPEHPYPCALDDARAAWDDILSSGHGPETLIVGGESAGANLAAALVLRLKAEGRPLPAAAYLLSGWFDLRNDGPSYRERAQADPMLSQAAMNEAAALFRPEGPRDGDFVSPALGDLDGFPPLLIQVGTDEVLLSDSLLMAERAALAGVDVTLRVWPGMVHAWPLFHVALPTAGLAAIREAGRWMAVRRVLTAPFHSNVIPIPKRKKRGEM
jgi:monoterpene epsilon-lactone hydrolase